MNNIKFINTNSVDGIYRPIPASENIPEWYKKTQSYVGGKRDIGYQGTVNSTIKKCQPVFDVLTAGYIISTYCDLYIKKNDNGEILYLTSQIENIQHHGIEQAPYHPNMNQHPYPKWINPWGIKTPPGYSVLIIPPVHGNNKYFTILEAIVDTDTYNSPVNFPFVLNDVNFEGIIPAGTPMAQVIPIKRESWSHQIINDKYDYEKTERLLTSKFYNRYKQLFWHRKEYK